MLEDRDSKVPSFGAVALTGLALLGGCAPTDPADFVREAQNSSAEVSIDAIEFGKLTGEQREIVFERLFTDNLREMGEGIFELHHPFWDSRHAAGITWGEMLKKFDSKYPQLEITHIIEVPGNGTWNQLDYIVIKTTPRGEK